MTIEFFGRVVKLETSDGEFVYVNAFEVTHVRQEPDREHLTLVTLSCGSTYRVRAGVQDVLNLVWPEPIDFGPE